VSDIFSEIDEDLRRDKATQAAKKYGPFAVVLAVCIVAAVGGYNWWQGYQEQQRQEMANAFTAADQLASEDPAAGAAALSEIAENAGSGFATVVRFREVMVRREAGDPEGALEVLRSIGADSSVDALYRDLAKLKLAIAEFETADQADLAQRFEDLSGPREPWRHTAREMLAVLALKSGDRGRARDLYQELVDDLEAPDGLRARAAEVLQSLPDAPEGS